MKFTFDLDTRAVRAALGESDRQVRFAGILTATKVAQAVKAAQERALPAVIDRPNPYTQRSLFMRRATVQRPVAEVWFKDDTAASRMGTPAAVYLAPQVSGGARRVKRFEKALQLAGHMPSGYQCVPGGGCKRDAYGNPSRGQIIQILSQLRITASMHERKAVMADLADAFVAMPGGLGTFQELCEILTWAQRGLHTKPVVVLDVQGFPLGYQTMLGERGVTLSGGQRQRLAIARALMVDAPILVLDDCLSAVDADTEAKLLQELEASMAGRTTIVISHRTSALAHCDEILVLGQGRVVERGRHRERR